MATNSKCVINFSCTYSSYTKWNHYVCLYSRTLATLANSFVESFTQGKVTLLLSTLQELLHLPCTWALWLPWLFLSVILTLWGSSTGLGRSFVAATTTAAHPANQSVTNNVTLKKKNKCIDFSWYYQDILLSKVLHTTADPTATPPAVAAICLNNPGCCGAAAGAIIGCDGGGACWAGTWLLKTKLRTNYRLKRLLIYKRRSTRKNLKLHHRDNQLGFTILIIN